MKIPAYTSFSGVNNVDPENRLHHPDSNDASAALSVGENIDLDNTGYPSRRSGYTLKLAGDCTSFYSDGETAVLVADGVLNKVEDDFTLTPLADQGFTTLGYAAEDGLIGFTSPQGNGFVVDGDASEIPTPTVPGMVVPPDANVICFAFGRWFYGLDSGIFYTDVGVTYIDPAENYIPVSGPVKMIIPGENGLFIGTETHTYFLAGMNPKKAILTSKSDFGVIRHAKVFIDGKHVLGGKIPGKLPAWIAENGLCLGLPDGQIYNLTGNKYAIPEGTSGSLAVIDKGYMQFVATVGTSAFAVNALTGAVTDYLNYSFDSIGVWKGKAYGVNATGLYELAGDLDGEAAIDAKLTLGTTDFGISSAKSIHRALVGSTGDLIIILSQPEADPIEYEADNDPPVMRYRFAKGVRGKEWTVTMQNVGGCDFKMDRLDLEVIAINRYL